MGRVRQKWENYLGLWRNLTGRKRVLFYILHYTVLFAVTFLLAYSPFLLGGKSFIWYKDARNQHYPTLVYIGRYLRQIIWDLLHGEIAFPLFDLNLAMGSDVIATLNWFGFGDPLNLLAALVPTHYIEYLYDILTVVRLYLAGAAFLALCKYHDKPFAHALMGALVYVFSGYMFFWAVRHYFFINPMIQLPLLLIGIDMVVRKKKPFAFILSVFYSALCGFYYLYMMTIMLGIYVLVRFFDWYKENRGKEFFFMAGRIIGTYLLGIGLSAPIFLPSVFGFLTSGREGGAVDWNLFSYGWSYYKNYFFRLIAFPGSEGAISLAAIVLFALAILFAFSRGKLKSLKVLCVISLIFYVLPLGGYIMNGFGYPSQRWLFGFTLLLSYIVVEVLPVLLNLDRKRQLFCFGILLLYAVVVFFAPKIRNVYNVVGVAMLALTLLTLCLLEEQHSTEEFNRCVKTIICTLLIVVNVSTNAIYLFAKDQGNYVSEFTALGAETQRLEGVLEREAERYQRQGKGRFDSSSFARNTGAVWRVPTMHTYYSMINGNIPKFMMKVENIGLRDDSFNIYGTNECTGIDALFSTKYFIEKKGKEQYVPYGYTLLQETDQGNRIYENQYALPWGYTYDSYLTNTDVERMNGLELEEVMLRHIVLEEDVSIAKGSVMDSEIQEIPYEVQEQRDVEWKNGILNAKKDNAVMILNFQLPEGTEGRLRLQEFDVSNLGGSIRLGITVKCAGVERTISVAGKSYERYYGRENYLVNLGYSEKERTTCTIIFPKKGMYKLGDIQLLALPMNKYPEQIEALRSESMENIKFGTNRITGTVDLSKDKILCVSIPYSKGWTAAVDGQKAEILKGNYMFMALSLEEGGHEIEFSYCTPGLRSGAVCALLSAGVVVYLAIRGQKKNRNRYKECGSTGE